MNRKWLLVPFIVAALFAISAVAIAQRSYRNRSFDPSQIDRNGVPEWENDARFKSDVYTFVRVRYSSYGRGGYGGRGGKWATDYPDAELNFSYRLQQLTTLDTDPNGRVLELTDDAIFDYP